MLACQRDLFDIPPEVAYLNCAYMSPLLRSSVTAGRAAFDKKLHPWTTTAPDFFREMEDARALFANLIGATSDDVALVPSTSYGLAVAAANIPVQAGQRIVLLDESFPSAVYTWQWRARDTQADIVLVSRPANHDWTSAVLEAIGDGAAVTSLPVCHWTDGAFLDLPAIARRVRETGGALVVDATQSLGVMPFSLGDIEPDFLVAATYKWLLGPYSLGFLYAAPHWHQGRPIEHNWIAREGSEDFAGLTRYRDGYQPGARRYDVGEPSNFVLLPVAIEGLRQILAWGVEEIYAATSRLADRIVTETAPLGFDAVPSDRRAGHYVGLRRPAGLPAGLGPALAARGVHVSVRGTALRITPHVYNGDEDIDRLIDALRSTVGQ